MRMLYPDITTGKLYVMYGSFLLYIHIQPALLQQWHYDIIATSLTLLFIHLLSLSRVHNTIGELLSLWIATSQLTIIWQHIIQLVYISLKYCLFVILMVRELPVSVHFNVVLGDEISLPQKFSVPSKISKTQF